MMDWLDEFLQWGPYGLYATFALMLMAFPLSLSPQFCKTLI